MRNLTIILLMAVTSLGCSDMFINPNKHDFYCKIDGKKFVPEIDDRIPGQVGSAPYRYTINYDLGSLFMTCRNTGKSITLRIKFPDKELVVGRYEISSYDNLQNYAIYSSDISKDNFDLYAESGWIEIKNINSSGFIGEFEFTTYNEYSGKKIKITNGKFKSKYYKPD